MLLKYNLPIILRQLLVHNTVTQYVYKLKMINTQHAKFWRNLTKQTLYEITQIYSSLLFITGSSLLFAPSFGDAHFWQRSTVWSYLGVLQVLHDLASDNVFGLIFHHSCLCLTPLTTSRSSIPISLLTLNSKPGKPFPYPHHPVHACVLEVPIFQQHLTAGLGNLPGMLFAWILRFPILTVPSYPSHHSFHRSASAIQPLNVGMAWTSELSLFSLLKWKSLSRVLLFVTPWTVALQTPPSMEFSRQEYWSGLLLPFPRNQFQPRDWTEVPCIAGRFFTIWATREAFSLL